MWWPLLAVSLAALFVAVAALAWAEHLAEIENEYRRELASGGSREATYPIQDEATEIAERAWAT